MNNIKQGRKFALISAACFLLCALYNIIPHIDSFYYGRPIKTVGYILLWIGLIGLVVTLFLCNKKFVLIATCVTIVGYCLLRLIYIDLYGILTILAYITLAIIAFLSAKGNVIVTRIWFLAGAIYLLLCLIIAVNAGFKYLLNLTFLSMILESVALLFTGLWLKTDLTPVIQQTTMNQALKPDSLSVIGGAEKLKTYKELLDSGAITQEEFDAKKKEILG